MLITIRIWKIVSFSLLITHTTFTTLLQRTLSMNNRYNCFSIYGIVSGHHVFDPNGYAKFIVKMQLISLSQNTTKRMKLYINLYVLNI